MGHLVPYDFPWLIITESVRVFFLILLSSFGRLILSTLLCTLQIGVVRFPS